MKNKRQTIFEGDKFTSNNFGEFVICRYVSSGEIYIQFTDSTVVATNSANVRSGKVRNPNHKAIYGRGFVGIGNFQATTGGVNTKEYNAWRNMFNRCYSEYELNRAPYRQGAEVDPVWYNFQVFAAWCHSQPSWGLDNWALDKDLLVHGNINYGPDTCCFLPTQLNTIFRRSEEESHIKLGEKQGTFLATIRDKDSVMRHLGTFDSKEKALEAYKVQRQLVVKQLANIHAEHLRQDVFDKLITWESVNGSTTNKQSL